ncbi:MAG: hypothetical protein LBF95_08450 [Treponema sp.]|nr:hypothetical protein [Treponema sp.]
MKKLLVVFLMLAVTGGIFAEITITGQIETGVNVTAEKDSDPTIRLSHSDPEGSELYVTGAATTGDGNFGILFGLQGDPLDMVKTVAKTALDVNNEVQAADLNPIRLDYTRVWGQFLDSKLKLLAGSSTGSIFSDGLWYDPGWDSVMGIKFEATPIDGFSFGVSLPLTIDEAKLEHAVKETRFGAKYKTDQFEIRGLLKLDDPDDGDTSNVDANFAVTVTTVPNFTFNVVGYTQNIDDAATRYASFAERVLYSNSPLTVGLWILEYADISDTKAPSDDYTKFAIYARPYVEYKLNDYLTPGFRVEFRTGMADYSVAKALAATTPTPDLTYSIQLRPYLTYNPISNITIYTYYNLVVAKDVTGKDDLTHTIQVNFGWYF